MKVAVIGAGAWGTAIAKLLCDNGHDVTLWGHNAAHLAALAETRSHAGALPGVTLPAALKFESELERAAAAAEMIVLAVPSQYLRETAARLPGFAGLIVSVTKGIEHDTGLTMCGILDAVMPNARAAALSGPSLALEVARGVPTAIVAAGGSNETASQVQAVFHRNTFRVYTSPDRLGVELGGALKNVIAIAAGVCDGLGFGDNSKAALVTRAIAEIRRLGVACGAKAETFAGLSGLGDLTLTCFARLSRNRGFGESLGRGGSATELLARAGHVVEGHPTARSAWRLARERAVETPIIDEVYALLYEGKPVQQAIADLVGRDSKAED